MNSVLTEGPCNNGIFWTKKNQCSRNLALLQAPLFFFWNLENKVRVLCKNWNIFAVQICLILQGPAMDSLFSGISIILSLFFPSTFFPCYKYVVLCENSLSSRISCTLIYVSYVMYFLYLLMYYLQLEQKQVPPPYRPTLESDRDLHNFPPEFTDEPVQLTPDDS